MSEVAKIKRVVVRTPNWVGDAVMSLPALHQLRQIFPTAHLTVASAPGSADIFTGIEFVDDVLPHRHTGRLATIHHARDWRQQRFDLAVLFQNAFAAAVTAALARVPVRIGYATDRRRG